MGENRIKVIYKNKFNNDSIFSYCMVDKDKYLLLKNFASIFLKRITLPFSMFDPIPEKPTT